MDGSFCPGCGTHLPEDPEGGQCTVCLLRMGLATTATTATATAARTGGGEDREAEAKDLPAAAKPDPEAGAGGGLGSVGPYRLERVLGEGGMGTVYLASQERPLRRKVALKLIKAGMDTREVVGRFEAERQVLALMDHPGIARVFDAGATETGRPYFVMERVEGEPITEYCDSRRLGLRTRLALFQEVCRAVQHAHQKGVIHRDLKPSNLLVAEDPEGRPMPKVIDFGIAKAMGEEGVGRTLATTQGQILGTPQYMSPEQAAGAAPDTRADVYALGAVLYELLTGTTPLPRERLSGVGVEETLRRVREEEPERPSARLGGLEGGAAARVAAGRREETAERWTRAVRGDLDWIVLKALEKEPGRRYESPGALADDLARHLGSEPVEARPPSRVYRMRKFARRNRALALSAGAIAAVLVAATAVSVRWALEATEARRLAEARLAQSDAVPDFLFRAFRLPDPTVGSTDLLAIDVLEHAAEEALREFADQPLLRARILEAIGTTYHGLGRDDKAAELWRLAEEGVRSLEDQAEVSLRLSRGLSQASRSSGNAEFAISLSERTWERLTREQGPGHPDTLLARLDLCRNLLEAAFWNDESRDAYLDWAEALLEEVFRSPQRFPQARLEDFRALEAQLASGRGDHETALEWWDAAMTRLVIEQKSNANSPRALLWPSRFLMSSLRRTGHLAESAAVGESHYHYCRSVFGPRHSYTIRAARSLSLVYEAKGRPETGMLVCLLPLHAAAEQVETLFAEGIEQMSLRVEELAEISAHRREEMESLAAAAQKPGQAPPPVPPELDRAEIWYWLSEIAWESGNIEASLESGKRAYELTVAEHAEDAALSLHRGNRLARKLVEAGDLLGAAAILTPQLQGGEITWRNGDLLGAAEDLADRLSEAGEIGEAASVARGVLEVVTRHGQGGRERLMWCYHHMRAPLVAAGEAHAHPQLYVELHEVFRQTLGPTHFNTRQMEMRVAETLLGAGRAAEALPLIRDRLRRAEEPDYEPDATTLFTQVLLGRALIGLKRYPEAEQALERAWATCLEWEEGGDYANPVQLRNGAVRTAHQFTLLYKATEDEAQAQVWERALAILEVREAPVELRSLR